MATWVRVWVMRFCDIMVTWVRVWVVRFCDIMVTWVRVWMVRFCEIAVGEDVGASLELPTRPCSSHRQFILAIPILSLLECH